MTAYIDVMMSFVAVRRMLLLRSFAVQYLKDSEAILRFKAATSCIKLLRIKASICLVANTRCKATTPSLCALRTCSYALALSRYHNSSGTTVGILATGLNEHVSSQRTSDRKSPIEIFGELVTLFPGGHPFSSSWFTEGG